MMRAEPASAMLYQIISLLLDVLIGVLAATCLLRLYMQHQRIAMSARSGNPLGRFMFAVSDWLVLPLRRVLPALGRWDLASLVATMLLEFGQAGLLWLLSGAQTDFLMLPLLALFSLARLIISLATGLVIIYALMSWLPGRSDLSQLVSQLCAAPLNLVRRFMPLVGGLDLSPLLLLLLFQVAAIVLASLQRSVF